MESHKVEAPIRYFNITKKKGLEFRKIFNDGYESLKFNKNDDIRETDLCRCRLICTK